MQKLSSGHISRLVEIERLCFTTAWDEKQFQTAFTLPIFAAFGLEDEDRLAAYVSVYTHTDEVEILNIAVAPAYRRGGLGKRLLTLVMTLARQLNAERVILEVRPSNTPARALYQLFGFVQAGRRPGYYTDTGEDALLLSAPVARL